MAPEKEREQGPRPGTYLTLERYYKDREADRKEWQEAVAKTHDRIAETTEKMLPALEALKHIESNTREIKDSIKPLKDRVGQTEKHIVEIQTQRQSDIDLRTASKEDEKSKRKLFGIVISSLFGAGGFATALVTYFF